MKLIAILIVFLPLTAFANIFDEDVQDCISEQIKVQFPYDEADISVGLIDAEDDDNFEAQFVLNFPDGGSGSVFVIVEDGDYKNATFKIPGLSDQDFDISTCKK
ncbi:MAG: hypothetical protein HRT44_13680 [Bdellovibrionales bacterium]|nr:hypothetical protein [Bdellovibrionales bacterium]NQZ20288.1 hypothetical protein [Bdellovibrionales bacterium]